MAQNLAPDLHLLLLLEEELRSEKMHREQFSGRILVIGCGAVSQCALPLILRHLDMPTDRITVVDFADNRNRVQSILQAGVRYVRQRITRQDYETQLSAYVGPGDLIVDLAWNLGCTDLLQWCYENDVMYVNTSIELWDSHSADESIPIRRRTLYARQMEMRPIIRGWQDRPGATAILEHGANPGLVSHFAKQSLLDISQKILEDGRDKDQRRVIEHARDDGAFNLLSQALGVKVIHISERDTQISNRTRQPNEFVNTWSVEGFYEEATAPAEIGWGTHETVLPTDAVTHLEGPRNQICLQRKGMDTFVQSCVPSGAIEGMVIRHGEAFSISEHLTVYDDSIYRPTVHYAYRPCDAAIESINELRDRDYKLQEMQRIMSDDIVSGWDELGCLMMGHALGTWWTGTVLDIDETRRLVAGQNPTTLQVAAAVIAAICWMIRNPRCGVLLPDHLPHDTILDIARPYLGTIISEQLDWMPTLPGAQNTRRGRKRAWTFDEFRLRRLPASPEPATPDNPFYEKRMAAG